MISLGMPVAIIGLYMFLGSLIVSFCVRKSQILKDKFKEKIYLVMMLALAFVIGLASVDNFVLVALLLVIARVIMGILRPVFSENRNRYIDNDNRATILGAIAFIKGGFSIVIDPLVGAFIDLRGISQTYVVLSISLAVFSLFYYLLTNKNKSLL
ncbi:MAG: hypothetical protein FWF57_07085 [Defluviitaleaceae bacterium]|nr:hypothetical protein [Defluviitaleaceae bacterium]